MLVLIDCLVEVSTATETLVLGTAAAATATTRPTSAVPVRWPAVVC